MQAVKLNKPKEGRTHDIIVTPAEAQQLVECDPSTIERLQLLLSRIIKVNKK